MTATVQIPSPEWLLGLDDVSFGELVRAKMFPPPANLPDELERNERLWMFLVDPDVVDRTHAVLTANLVDVNHQLAAKKAEREAFRSECAQEGHVGRKRWTDSTWEYEDWRRRVTRFKQGLERRLALTKSARRTRTEVRTGEMNHQHRMLLAILAGAIHAHQQESVAAGLDPEDHDRALWALPDENEVPLGESQTMTSLRDMIDGGMWASRLR